MPVEDSQATAPRTDVVAVVGACVPERHQCARRLAADRGMVLLPAGRVTEDPEAVDSAVALVGRGMGGSGLVIEYPVEHPVTEIIGVLADEAGSTRLRELVCVVDAAHVLADLSAEGHIPVAQHRDGEDSAPIFASRAGLIVAQIEYASVVLLTNCRHLRADEMSLLTAAISHLAPRARLHIEQLKGNSQVGRLGELSQEQASPGWLCLLNGEFSPVFRDPGVGAVRYEQMRPFHPGRLKELLDFRMACGEFGLVLRSVGFCHLATRPHITAQWDQVGENLLLSPAALDHQLTAEDEPLALGQDLAFIGIGLEPEELIAGLDDAALTDAELVVGPMAWAGFPDPFPGWQAAEH